MPRPLAAVLLATLTMAAIAARPAVACDCVGSDVVLRLQNNPWVFIGTVRVVSSEGFRGAASRISISIDETFRSPEGAMIPATFVVERSEELGNCNLDLDDGSRWIFFLRDLRSWPLVCNDNLPLAPEEDGKLSFWAEYLPDLLRTGAFDDGARFPWRFLGQDADHCQLQIRFHPQTPLVGAGGVIYLHESRREPLSVGIHVSHPSELDPSLEMQRAFLATGDRSLRILRHRRPEDRSWSRWSLDEGDAELLLLQFQASQKDRFEIQIEAEEPFHFEDILRAEAFDRFETCRESLPLKASDP